jgi:hypothetical protein
MILTELLPAGRWRMLRALWLDGATDSVHALAKQYQLSYSSAYAELKRLERASLALSKVVGNSLIYRANKANPWADAVEAFVRATNDSVSARDDYLPPLRVMANLLALGVPLRSETVPDTDITPEDAVAQGLRLTHSDPSLVRAYPVLLGRNRNRLSMELLSRKAIELNEKRTLGFFLELTGMLANDRHLRSFAQTLKDRRFTKVCDFFEFSQGKYARSLAEQRTPRVAKDWRFRLDMDMDNFRNFYSKFCEV